MSNSTAVDKPLSLKLSEKIENVLVKGDLSGLNESERVLYYQKVCDSVGLNSLTKPFDYLTLNNKLVLYATKTCTDQLRAVHRISIEIVSREKVGEVYVVTARAKDPSGRTDESTGAVALGKAYGDTLANLYMKAETKAKRRVTLSICGLGLLDESEVETIPGAQRAHADQGTSRPVDQIQESNPVEHPPEQTAVDHKTGEVSPPAEEESAQNILPSERAIEFGKKYKGKKFKEFTVEQIQSYIKWIKNEAAQNNKPLSDVAEKFIHDGEMYIEEVEIPF